MSLERRDSLLLFIDSPGGRFPTDQIRIMKGLFLLDQEGPAVLRHLYRFEPYSYGPFATDVYRDLDALEAESLIRYRMVQSTRQRIYEVTPSGAERAAALRADAAATILSALQTTKEFVTSLDFVELLRQVYAKYPEYAAKSVARL